MSQTPEILKYAQIVAGVFSLLSILFSLWLIYKHLRNYTTPTIQRYIVRILLMVPIYASDSWLSLFMPNFSILWDLLRDCYEAYCIFCFFGLIVTYVQTSQACDVGHHLEGKEKMKHPFPLGFLPRITLGRKFLRQCYQFILQFVFLKPMISLISVLLYYYDPKHYNEQSLLQADNAYLWLTLIENVSITLAMYYLVLYYMATKQELAPFRPVGKFLCIKMVIFFSFWQGVAIDLLTDFNIVREFSGISEGNVGRILQDFIICIEMFILSILHHYVFPYGGFRNPDKQPFLWDPKRKRLFVNAKGSMKPVVSNFFKVASVTDVLEDTRNSFLVPLAVSAEGIKVVQQDEEVEDFRDDSGSQSILVIDEYEPLLKE